jgi:hypothetical protein
LSHSNSKLMGCLGTACVDFPIDMVRGKEH